VAPLRPYLNRDTIVVTLQNGLGNASALRAALLRDGMRPHVYLGVTAQAAMRVEPGVIVHSGSGITAIGRRANPVNASLSAIAQAMSGASLQTVAVDDIHRWVWRKLAVNAAINPLTALGGVENRAIASDPALKTAAETIAKEVVTLGKATGVKIDVSEVLAAIEDVARSTGDNRSSMLVDLENGLPTEIDAINGAIVAEARRHAIKVPANQAMTALVRAREGRWHDAAEEAGDLQPGDVA
jgi:2-dehydropantoate 2-reductase